MKYIDEDARINDFSDLIKDFSIKSLFEKKNINIKMRKSKEGEFLKIQLELPNWKKSELLITEKEDSYGSNFYICGKKDLFLEEFISDDDRQDFETNVSIESGYELMFVTLEYGCLNFKFKKKVVEEKAKTRSVSIS